jgi:hypothetical protein
MDNAKAKADRIYDIFLDYIKDEDVDTVWFNKFFKRTISKTEDADSAFDEIWSEIGDMLNKKDKAKKKMKNILQQEKTPEKPPKLNIRKGPNESFRDKVKRYLKTEASENLDDMIEKEMIDVSGEVSSNARDKIKSKVKKNKKFQ